MTQTRTITVHAPMEPPELPKHFNFWKYEVSDSHDADHFADLEIAVNHWFDDGPVSHDLCIYAESDTFPGGGTDTIYAVWIEKPSGLAAPYWDGWYYESSGEKFDPAECEREFTAKDDQHD